MFGDVMSQPGSPTVASANGPPPLRALGSSSSLLSLASISLAARTPDTGRSPVCAVHAPFDWRGETSILAVAHAAALSAGVSLGVARAIAEDEEAQVDDALPPVPLWKTSRDLFECIDRFGAFCEDRARVVFAQLVDVVEHLHKSGIVHRDIKDENVRCVVTSIDDRNAHGRLTPNASICALHHRFSSTTASKSSS